MGSQFVDFNADGHLDYVTATFDGSPHVSYGSQRGFQKPQRLKDSEGRRILISYFWNYEDREHQKTGRSMPDGRAKDERCISSLAFDWDADGDFDLLLGSYENGRLYRQMNEGTNAKPRFTGKNIPVMAGSAPFALAAKMTAPRLVDWDGDGDMDLIAGTFGDSYGGKSRGGGVYLARNAGSVGKPRFGALETLIPASLKGGHEPTRPDAGLYADAVDYDGDGDLDLVVGAYSVWKPKPRQLSDKEQAEVDRLKDEQKAAGERRQSIIRKMAKATARATAGLDRNSTEFQAKRAEIQGKFSDDLEAATKASQAIARQLDALIPSPKREPFVWLYERLPAAVRGTQGN